MKLKTSAPSFCKLNLNDINMVEVCISYNTMNDGRHSNSYTNNTNNTDKSSIAIGSVFLASISITCEPHFYIKASNKVVT